MNYAKINHPALVALQGRLRGILQYAEHNGRLHETPAVRAIRDEARAAIAEIDGWLTAPEKQVREDREGACVYRCPNCGDPRTHTYASDSRMVVCLACQYVYPRWDEAREGGPHA